MACCAAERLSQPNEELPYPPEQMRLLVGSADLSLFDNPPGRLVVQDVPIEAYDSVLDSCSVVLSLPSFTSSTPT